MQAGGRRFDPGHVHQLPSRIFDRLLIEGLPNLARLEKKTKVVLPPDRRCLGAADLPLLHADVTIAVLGYQAAASTRHQFAWRSAALCHRMSTTTIRLRFADCIRPEVRPRIDYAFRVFAAIYGYCVVAPEDHAASCCLYGAGAGIRSENYEFLIPARYSARTPSCATAPLSKHRYAGEDLFLAFGVDESSGRPDWLGEIFSWLSAELERSIDQRDSVGRIPYSETVFHRQGLSPLDSHAGRLMAWFENALRGNDGFEALPKAPSPLPNVNHAVIASHDIDFYLTNKSDAFRRLSKNIVLSATHYRSASFCRSNVRMFAGLLGGEQIGDYIPRMVDEIQSLGFRSTLFAVAEGRHRRDPDYEITRIAPRLRDAAAKGFEVALHGSYDSVIVSRSLESETEALKAAAGKRPIGGRQHWLRFGRQDQLYRCITDAKLAYDSSLGFAETCGFRNGACFSFPPYDFENERACSFLEIPLVIMDGSLHLASQRLGKASQVIADKILAESRSLGWGGIAILWHNPIEPLQVPAEINEVFWNSAKKRKEYGEEWMSAQEFLKAGLCRYQNAGLLKEVRVDA